MFRSDVAKVDNVLQLLADLLKGRSTGANNSSQDKFVWRYFGHDFR